MSYYINGAEIMDYVPCEKCESCKNFKISIDYKDKYVCTPGYGRLIYVGKGDAASTLARETGKKYSSCEHFLPKIDTSMVTLESTKIDLTNDKVQSSMKREESNEKEEVLEKSLRTPEEIESYFKKREEEEKERIAERNRQNEQWTTYTTTGSNFLQELDKQENLDDEKKEVLIEEARNKYAIEFIHTQQIVLSETKKIQNSTDNLFDLETKELVDGWLEITIEDCENTVELSDLDSLKKFTECNFKEIPKKRKVLNLIRLYCDIICAFSFCSAGLGFIFTENKNLNTGIIYIAISVFFLILPIFRKIRFKTKVNKIMRKNKEEFEKAEEKELSEYKELLKAAEKQYEGK